MSQQSSFFPLAGGLDLATPAIALPAGRVIAGENYEPVQRGYRRVDGYERLDGRPAPSAASYWLLRFTDGSGQISAGDAVLGHTSGATATVLADMTIAAGSLMGGDAEGFLVLTALAGAFVDGEEVRVGGVPLCLADGVAAERAAPSDEDDHAWLTLAVETARSLIGAVPGQGPVRGVWSLKGSIYAVRDNVGGTAGILHKATAGGWVAQDLGRTIDFTSGGTTEIEAGNTITGATSAATATVLRVLVASGTWAGGDAAGRLILGSQTGTFTAENLNVGASPNLATVAGDSAAQALPPGGAYDFVTHNFYGASDLVRMYGVNGAGRAFEWDGAVFVPIITGMVADTPNRIAIHRNHLFLSFPGGSIQFSPIGDPTAPWLPVLGAGEIGLGQDVTGMLGEWVNSLVIFGRNKVAVLYGNDATDFALETIATDAGAAPRTAQKIRAPVYLDDGGLRDLRTTQNFGDFAAGTITQMVQRLLDAKRRGGITATASLRVRAKDQYRLFWSDGTGLTVYFGRKSPEVLPFSLGFTVRCAASSEDADGNEILLAAGDDGHVYRLDSGTSFDGDRIDAYLRLPFNHVGAPNQSKRWHAVEVQLDGGPATTLGLLQEFAYADPARPAGPEQSFVVRGGGGFWGESDFDAFHWSSSVEGVAHAHIDGEGENMSLCIVSRATREQPHTLHGIVLWYSPRRLRR